MRAGLLRERILMQKKTKTQSVSGAETFAFTTILSTKCHKIKENNFGGEVNAKEEFYESSLRIQARNNPIISEATHAVFQSNRYRIVLADYNIKDRTVILTLRKDNE